MARRIPETYAALLLMVLGVLMRVVWMLRLTSHTVSEGESANVAVAWARTGAFADAFFPGQGPTAHVTPISPLVAGLVYRVFGIQTPVSEDILTAWSLALIFGSFWLLYRAFARLGSPVAARLLGLAGLCLLPLNLTLEVVWFRTWDGGLAVALGAAFLLTVIALDQAERVSMGQVVATAFLAAVLLFVTPPVGVAAYLCGAILLIKKVPMSRWLASIAIVAAVSVLVLTPWAIRNELVMGKPILLRDNFGLELAQANYAEAVTNPDHLAQFTIRNHQIHPNNHPEILRANGGEVAYADKLGREAKAWIAANPLGFARLTARHLGEMFFPPTWYWEQFGSKSKGTDFKLYANWIISVLGLVGLAYRLFRKSPGYAYVALMTLVPLGPYILVQPTLRYRYTILALLVFLSADLLIQLASRLFTAGKPAST